MKDFGTYHSRAIRREPVDWSEHYVDYDQLKAKLREYLKKRKALRRIIQHHHHKQQPENQQQQQEEEDEGSYHCHCNCQHESNLSEDDMILLYQTVSSTTANRIGCTRRGRQQTQEQRQRRSYYYERNNDKNNVGDYGRSVITSVGYVSCNSSSPSNSSTDDDIEPNGDYYNYDIEDMGQGLQPRYHQKDRRKQQQQQLLRDVHELIHHVTTTEREDFCNFVNQEMQKAAKFYEEQLEKLRQILEDISLSRSDSATIAIQASASNPIADSELKSVAETTTTSSSSGNASTSFLFVGEYNNTINDIDEEEFIRIGNEILELYAFVVVNTITIRQIFIRYDALVRTFEGIPMSQECLFNREWYTLDISSLETIIQKLISLITLNDDNTGSTTVLTERGTKLRPLALQFNNWIRRKMKVTNITVTRDLLVDKKSRSTSSNKYHENFFLQLCEFRTLLDKTLSSVERSASGNVVLRDILVSDLRRHFLFGARMLGLELEPKFLLLRGRHLKEEMKLVAQWRARRSSRLTGTIITTATNNNNNEDENNKNGKSRGFFSDMEEDNILPLFLNLLSCFLHMANNSVIEPSSAYYANALGSNDALSGLMVGFGPWFVFMSSIVYSYWTNYQYKAPILFGALLQCIGNFIYANAYRYKSMELCLLGRAIAGLESPRLINRRYVADATPFSLRTAISAIFALTTALGTTAGPLVAILLDVNEFEFDIPLLGKQYFNGMTGPGYVMSVSWGIYLVIILMFFREPNRSGLEELKRREEAELLSSSSAVGHQQHQEKDAWDNDDESIEDTKLQRHKQYHICFIHGFGNNNNKNRGGCFRHITKAVALCMLLLFMKRIVLENIIGSISVITKNRYNWNIQNIGSLHFLNGILIIPISIIAGWSSQFYQDRYLTLWFLSVALIGIVILIDITDFLSNDSSSTTTSSYNEGDIFAVSQERYVLGVFITFTAMEGCESFIASLMTKVVPSTLAAGTFNSGLLATLVGTAGRATGDVLITVLGLISLRNLLNLLMVPCAVFTIISLLLIKKNYSILNI